MAHNIFGSRFVGQRKSAWHNLGQVINDDAISMVDALKVGGIDFTYYECPIEIILPDGTGVRSGKKQMIMRAPTADDPEWVEMNDLVSLDYRVIQNAALAEGLDRVRSATAGTSRRWARWAGGKPSS